MKPRLWLEGDLVVAAQLFVSRSKGGFLGRSTGEVPRRRFARLEAQTIRDGLLHRPVGGDRRDGELDAVVGGGSRQSSTSVSASSQRPIISDSAREAIVVRVGVGMSIDVP